MDELLATAESWLELDPENAGILTHEISAARRGDEQAISALTARFAGYLTFGTAGIRAPLGPGTTRMNRVVVARAAAGIADFACEALEQPVVVIGYDARHQSKDFAMDSAAVFVAAGCQVHLVPTMTPTPILAYALKQLGADVGIMVTASHNPPTDNGYKVYLGPRLTDEADTTGAFAQINAPTDQLIAAHIHRWNTVETLPAMATSGWQYLPETLIGDYIDDVTGFVNQHSDGSARRDLNIVYTPLHGVGATVFSELMLNAGFDAIALVDQQVDPDPTFPTVAFPNPEEPGALDLAISTANSLPTTDVILAHDPDADRLAVVVPISGEWRQLSGDHVGLLLGARLMPWLANERLTVANSIVSAPQLGQLAAQHQVAHRATPTGFKWICRVRDLGYGYEEALGYAVAPHLVNDKDGISAAIVLADLAAELKAAGRSLVDYLIELTEQLGPTVTDQVAIPVVSPTVGTALVDDLRSNPPTTLAGRSPVQMVDYQQPETPLATDYGPINMLEFSTGGAIKARLMIRPSGTEPKMKCYVSVSAAPGTPVSTVQTALDELRDEATMMVNIE